MHCDDIKAILDEQGLFHAHMPRFRPRRQQRDMAVAVCEAIRDGQSAIIEAGTGTGKTFAYLVPALLANRKVIISTGTKALQDQLFFNDIPRVKKVLGSNAKVSLLKGRANYLCLYRLHQAIKDGHHGKQVQAQLARIRAWSAQTQRGDKMELADISENDPIWQTVTSTADNCLGTDCPFYDDCFVYKARHEAAEADIVVVNHHLLLADLVLKQSGFGDLLPATDVFIIDEAHQLPELGGVFLSTQVSYRQISELIADIRREAEAASGALSLLLDDTRAVTRANDRCLLALQDIPSQGAFAHMQANATIKAACDDLLDALARLDQALATQAERTRGLERCDERLQLLLAHMQKLLRQTHADTDGDVDVDAKDTTDSNIFWYEHTSRTYVLHMTPLALAPEFRKLRQINNAPWIYTSATLSVAGKFDHFMHNLGLDDVATHRLESPFDYARQTLCYLPQDLPNPNTEHYTDAVVEAIKPVLEASCGRAFLLFTSHRALRRAAELLSAQTDWPLFVQGTASKHILLQRFRDSGNGLLLGAASFWQGIDVVGDALSMVMIDKLPFAAPDNPVLQARIKAMQDAGENPFMQYQVPTAAIALKQGVGRLIRDIHDRGVLMLCDPRLTTKGYGRLFLRSLPPLPRTRELADVVQFFDPS